MRYLNVDSHAHASITIMSIINYFPTITNVLLSEVIIELNFRYVPLIYAQFINVLSQHYFELNDLHFIDLTIIGALIHVSLLVYVKFIMNHVYHLLHLSLPL